MWIFKKSTRETLSFLLRLESGHAHRMYPAGHHTESDASYSKVHAHCHAYKLGEGARIGEQRLELAVAVERHHAAEATIVAAAQELATNVKRRHRGTASELGQLSAQRVAISNLVELNDRVCRTITIKDLLGLDAKGSGRKGKHYRWL